MADTKNTFNANAKDVSDKISNLFGFDMSKMMNPSYLTDLVSNNEMAKFFDASKVQEYFENLKSYNVDTKALFELQQQNVNAIVEANKKAAAGYQDVMKKQLGMLEATMSTVKDKMKADPKKTGAASTKEVSTAMEKMLGDASELVSAVQKANTEAATIISDRIEKNFSEFKTIVKKAA